MDVKLDVVNPENGTYIWRSLVKGMGHEGYVKMAEKKMCLKIQENMNDPDYEPTLEIPDDPELTLHENVNEVLLSQGNPTVSKKLDFAPSQRLLESNQNVAESEYPIIDGDDVNRILGEAENDDQAMGILEDSLNLDFSGIPPGESEVCYFLIFI